MFLTRFEINAARRASRALLSSPQRLHAAVLAAFPSGGSEVGDEGRVLWRLDEQAHDPLLYIVSPARPDLTHLVESVGRPAIQSWDTRDYRPFLDRLAKGDQWAFRLTANPVRSGRKRPGASETQRFGHVTVDQQTEWLLRQADRHGFRPTIAQDEPDVAVRGRRAVRFARHERTVTLSMATFEGRLEVVDPVALRTALTGGVGPAKAYGCGLLTLAR